MGYRVLPMPGSVAQSADASVSKTEECRFESYLAHQLVGVAQSGRGVWLKTRSVWVRLLPPIPSACSSADRAKVS